MDAFDFDASRPRNNSVNKDEKTPDSVTAMFSVPQLTPSEAGPAAGEDILSQLKAANPKLVHQAQAQPLNSPQTESIVRREKDAGCTTRRPTAQPVETAAGDTTMASPIQSGRMEASPPAGEFTQFFQALGSPVPSMAANDQAEAPAAPQSYPDPAAVPASAPQAIAGENAPAPDMTRIFTQLPTPRHPDTPAQPPTERVSSSKPAPPAGEFTRMMQAFTSAAASGSPAPEAQHATPVPSGQAPAAVTPPDSPAAASPARIVTAPSSNSGSFTSLFESMTAPPRHSDQHVSQGKFEPLASPVTGPPKTSKDTPKEAWPDRSQEGSPDRSQETSRDSLTRVFEVPSRFSPSKQPPDSVHPPEPEFPFRNAVPAAKNSPGNQGGFTQLFQALNEQEPAPKDRMQFSSQPLTPSKPPMQQAPMQAGPGEFTRLLQALGESPVRSEAEFFPSAPASSSIPSSSPVAQGPGEFTRMISAPTLREIQAHSEAQNAPSAGPSSAATGPAALPLGSLPQAPPMPQFQMPRAPGPVAPPTPQSAPANPPFQMPAAAIVPPLPAPAPPKMPAIPAPVAPKTKMQEYLPILLVANAFLLLLLVVLVVFALRHR